MGKSKITADHVLKVLREGPFREPAHAWLYNVRNGTGFSRQDRYADAVVVSCWPSRGIWIAGIEVKVDRHDWKRELDHPTKSAEIQKWCDYWWIAAPPGVVELGEVPESWGLCIAPREKGKQIIAKPAPKLKAEDMTPTFVASMLRNHAQNVASIRQRVKAELRAELVNEEAEEKIEKLNAQLYEAQRAKSDAESKLHWAEQNLAGLKATIGDFERETGLPSGLSSYRGGGYTPQHMGACFKVAEVLAKLEQVRLSDLLRGAIDSLESLTIITKKTGTGNL